MPCGTQESGSGDRVGDRIKTTIDLNTGNVTETNLGSNYLGSERLVTTGQCIPNFHRRKARGELLPHTHFRQVSIEESQESLYSVTYLSGGDHFNYQQTNWAFTDSYWRVSEAELLRLLEGLDAQYYVQAAAARIYARGHDTLTFLAEIHKAKSMFADVVRRFAKAATKDNSLKRALSKRNNTRVIKDRVRQASKDWLQWRYGWRTLIYDLQDLSEAIADLDSKKQRFSERAGTSVRNTVTDIYTGSFTSSNWIEEVTSDIEISLRGSVTADISPASFSFNAPRTAWELVPYSFVVDWLINIGQSLEALSFLTFQTNYVASSGFQATIKRRTVFVPSSWKTGYSGFYNRIGTSTGVYQVRSPTSVSIKPQTNIRIDGLKVADSLALLRGLLNL